MAANAYGWVTNPSSQSQMGMGDLGNQSRSQMMQSQGEQGYQGPTYQRRDYGPPPAMNQGYRPSTQFGQGYNPQTFSPDFFSPGNGFGELGSFNQYTDKEMRQALNSYANNYAIPASNLALQRNDQAFNQANTIWTNNEQGRMNDFNMGLQNQANWRENTGLQFSMDKYQQDFGEAARQFNQGLDLQNRQLQGQNQYQQGQLQNTATANRNQYDLGLRGDQTARQGQQLNYQLGQGQIAQDRYNTDTGYRTAQMQNATSQRGQDYNYQIGMGQNANQAVANQQQFQLGQGRNSNELLGIQNQNAFNQGQLGLGQGRLSLDTRQSALDNAYRYRALNQDAALTRERLNNEMLQSRYATFGHAQMPNFRMMNSYR